MNYERHYWRSDPDAPFAGLMEIAETYFHPEAQTGTEIEELREFIRMPTPPERIQRFVEQHREALEYPERLPDNYEHLGDAAEFSDGTDERFLRRLWRDLYPGESVPGGDEEFREDLRRTITAGLTSLTSTTRYYIDLRRTDRAAAAREVWERFFPDEAPPEAASS